MSADETTRRRQSPLYAWEQDRALVEEAEGILTTEAFDRAVATIAAPVEPVCLLSESRAGFGVQLLAEPSTGRSWITCMLNGDTETFEVAPEDALDAYRHPFAYGATLAL